MRGVVQGVGFRPFVYSLASKMHLAGFVTNTTSGVSIEVEGERQALDSFERELVSSAPPLARIESVAAAPTRPRGEREFLISPSRTVGVNAPFVSPDAATCDACVAELFDPTNRRYRYPFITCTMCGPRLTIVTGAPYDRCRTTMARFTMCEACRDEYVRPTDRRFHAETVACAVCGPRLFAIDAGGGAIDGDPIDLAAEAIARGQIVAVKGLGGFHLACSASRVDTVATLRRRKARDDKPFAVMVRGLAAARSICHVDEAEAALLSSPAHPIVLLRSCAGVETTVAPLVAPDTPRLGLMLPYTPVHHLLFDALKPFDVRILVMTSGNHSDEPIATDNDDAIERLHGVADLFIVHDRPIHVRCDDSVVAQASASPIVVRRSRGYAPAPIPLPFEVAAPILAVGGQLKNTFAVARGRHAFVSHHVGDLDDLRALEAYERDLTLFEEMLHVAPRVVAYDAHPDYASTRIALGRTADRRIAVQHHHAHVASCMAEHGLDGPVIGIAWDGAGWGPDGSVWGGEFLVADYRRFERAAHFRAVALPGGDRAAREPWRMAVAHSLDAGVDDDQPPPGVTASTYRAVRQMVERRIQSPLTTSVGRLFDAVGSMCDVRQVATFEGQAAMQLEQLAALGADNGAYEFDIVSGRPLVVDTRRLISSVRADVDSGTPAHTVARRFHASLAEVALAVSREIHLTTGSKRVVLTGGVFLNALLTTDLESRLVGDGFEVYRHRLVPPGDGGLCLGQLAVAATVLEQGG